MVTFSTWQVAKRPRVCVYERTWQVAKRQRVCVCTSVTYVRQVVLIYFSTWQAPILQFKSLSCPSLSTRTYPSWMLHLPARHDFTSVPTSTMPAPEIHTVCVCMVWVQHTYTYIPAYLNHTYSYRTRTFRRSGS